MAPGAAAGAAAGTGKHKHVMVSYQWDVQEAVVRIVGSLKQRGFAVWFDLDQMSGSTLDARPAPNFRVLVFAARTPNTTGSTTGHAVAAARAC